MAMRGYQSSGSRKDTPSWGSQAAEHSDRRDEYLEHAAHHASSQRRIAGWLSSCDRWQKVTRWAIPTHLRAVAHHSRNQQALPSRSDRGVPCLAALLDYARPGDAIVVAGIDRHTQI